MTLNVLLVGLPISCLEEEHFVMEPRTYGTINLPCKISSLYSLSSFSAVNLTDFNLSNIYCFLCNYYYYYHYHYHYHYNYHYRYRYRYRYYYYYYYYYYYLFIYLFSILTTCRFHIFFIILSNCKAHLIMFGMKNAPYKFQLLKYFWQFTSRASQC